MSGAVDPLGLALLVVLAALTLGLIWLVLRLRAELDALKSSDPTTGLVVLQNQLDALRDQLRSSLEGGSTQLDRRLEETNRVVGEVRRGLGEVDRQVRSVGEVARDLRSLQELLRAPKMRGGMGEFLLGDLLSEVLPAAHYGLQHVFSTGERVDAVITVGPRLVPVDSKFPLDSYRNMAAAETDEQTRTAQRAFRTDVRRHVDAISTKYIRPGENTYDFALMYIPAESVYHAAFLGSDAASAELVEYAVAKRVIPVSPQSFYAYLQVILLGLRGLTIEERAQEILSNLSRVRTRLERFTESFELAARHLGNANRQMDESARRLGRVDTALLELERKDHDADPVPSDDPTPATRREDIAH